MKKNKWIFFILAWGVLAAIIISGCTTKVIEKDEMIVDDDSMNADGQHDNDSSMMDDDSLMDDKDSMIADSAYHGEILAGSVTPYLAFDKIDYDKAVSENKIILLYFYANWCPICKAEQVHTYAAFDELKREDVIGFRVNYRDSDVDENEEDLAKEHGITYQHTKVILQNGERVLKAPDSWDKDRYLEEIGKLK